MRNALLISFVLILTLPQLCLAKSYSYDMIDTSLAFEPNGTVIVSQERQYNFDGSFSFAYLDLKKGGADDITFESILDLSTNQSVPYELEEDSSHAKATWRYTANDEVKRFLITYRIDGAVRRYGDVAEFYWKIIEDEHERIGLMQTSVNLPEPSPGQFKIFVHSSAQPGELNFSEDYSSARVTMNNIPRNSFVEFRILMDPSIFPQVEQTPVNQIETILEEETRTFYPGPSAASILLSIALLAVPIAAIILFYRRNGKDPKVDYALTYEQEPPSNIPPMALSNLMEGAESKTDIRREAMGLIATIFDLARKGYLEVSEEKRARFLIGDKVEQVFTSTKKASSGLLDFEKETLSFIFSCGKNSKKVTSSEIVSYCRRHQYSVKKTIEGIDEMSRKWFEKKHFKITENVSGEAKKRFHLSMLAVIIACIVSLPLIGALSIMPLIAAGSVMLIAQYMTRRTQESSLEAKKWMAFKRYVSDFSAMKDAPAVLLKLWDEYLVYAIALGVAKKLLDNLKELSLVTGKSIHAVAWYHGINPVYGNMIRPESITGFVNGMSHTVDALSSSSSVGGGFSGGGGAGGGGGGSGAG